MIKNSHILKKFNDDFLKNEKKRTFSESLRIFEAMWKEAVKLKALPLKNPLEGIEVDIQIAKVLNSCSKNLSQE